MVEYTKKSKPLNTASNRERAKLDALSDASDKRDKVYDEGKVDPSRLGYGDVNTEKAAYNYAYRNRANKNLEIQYQHSMGRRRHKPSQQKLREYRQYDRGYPENED